MRHVLALVVLGGVVGGCAAIRGLDEYTTADRPPEAPASVDAGSSIPPAESGAGKAGCRDNLECIELATREANARSS